MKKREQIFIKSLYNSFFNNEIFIEEDDFSYGISILFRYIAFLLITIPILLYFNLFKQSLSFIVFYFYLRHYTGGIHLSNAIMCTFFSVVIVVVYPLLGHIIVRLKLYYVFMFFFVNICFIYFHKTIDHKNKPLTKKEIKCFTKKAIFTEVIYFFFYIIFAYLKYAILANGIILAMSLCTLELILITLSNVLKNKKNNYK